MTRRELTWVLGVLGAGLATVADFAPPSYARPPEPKELIVYAAASLREVFQDLATAFEKNHQGVKVRFNFAGSQELRVQIENGAEVDVFASADDKQMVALQRQSLLSASAIFAQNQPVLVVPTANPAGLTSFADLPRAEHIVVGVPEVPIGAYAETVFANAERFFGKPFGERIAAHIHSRELNVRQVLTKVALGEADVGIVYKTDALAAKDRVSMIPIPQAVNVTAWYPIGVLASSPHPELARAWVGAALAKQGQDTLAAAGFNPPPPARMPAKAGK